MTADLSAPAPVLYKVADLEGDNGILRMSRREIYNQIQRGRLRAVKQGRATFITPAAVAAYVALLEDEAAHHPAQIPA